MNTYFNKKYSGSNKDPPDFRCTMNRSIYVPDLETYSVTGKQGSSDDWQNIILRITLSARMVEAYSAAGKTYLHEKVENQEEHAIQLGLPYLQRLVMFGNAE